MCVRVYMRVCVCYVSNLFLNACAARSLLAFCTGHVPFVCLVCLSGSCLPLAGDPLALPLLSRFLFLLFFSSWPPRRYLCGLVVVEDRLEGGHVREARHNRAARTHRHRRLLLRANLHADRQTDRHAHAMHACMHVHAFKNTDPRPVRVSAGRVKKKKRHHRSVNRTDSMHACMHAWSGSGTTRLILAAAQRAPYVRARARGQKQAGRQKQQAASVSARARTRRASRGQPRLS